MLLGYAADDFFDDLHLSEKGAKKDANAWFDAVFAVLNNTPNNLPPVCSITAPSDNASFTAPATINFTVNATDPDGNISKVEYFNGSVKIGESTASPFSFSWTNVSDGTYPITAVATDNFLVATTSPRVILNVAATDNYVKFLGTGIGSPGSWQNNGFTFDKALDSNLTTYFDGPVPDGQWVGLNLGVSRIVRKIRYSPRPGWPGRMINAKIQGANSADFSDAVDIYTITTLPVEGIFTTARFNNGNSFQYYRILSPLGGYGNIADIEFWGNPNGLANQSPSCVLTTPFNNSIYSPSANVGLSVTAADTDGSISKVEFFNDNTLIGTVTASPFIFIWPGVPAGTYTVKAKATDNLGADKTSNAISITVGLGSGGIAYAEDFNTNTSAGWAADGGLWGAANQKYESTDWNGEFTSIYNGGSFSNFTYQVDAVAIWNNDIGFVFNYTNANNYYRLVINTNDKTASLQKKINGNISTITNGTFSGGGAGAIHAIYISNNGANTTVKINGVVVFNSIATTELAGGKIGLYAFYCPSYFDNILVGSSNSLPLVDFSSPVTESSYSVGSDILFSTTTSDLDGSVSKVDFYHEDVLLGSSSLSPFSFTWLDAPAGKYNVSSIATDDAGGKRTSSALRILVGTVVLPIKLTKFTVIKNGSVNQLSWTTEQEINAANFIIERSNDGSNFIKIGQVQAAGNSNVSNTYYFLDNRPIKGTNFYRLRSVDRDNQFKLSDIKSINNNELTEMVIYPNPVQDRLTVSVNVESGGNSSLIITDVGGRTLLVRNSPILQGINNIAVDMSTLIPGTYFLTLQLANRLFVKKFYKK